MAPKEKNQFTKKIDDIFGLEDRDESAEKEIDESTHDSEKKEESEDS